MKVQKSALGMQPTATMPHVVRSTALRYIRLRLDFLSQVHDLKLFLSFNPVVIRLPLGPSDLSSGDIVHHGGQ